MAAEPSFDLAVVGGGPAGIAAAVGAAEHGARVVVIDEGPRPGGQIWRGSPPPRAGAWLERLAALGERVSWRCDHAVVDAWHEAGRFELICAGPVPVPRGQAAGVRLQVPRLVLATGARERFLPFVGWTGPTVLGVGAIQALAKQGLALAGRRVVVAGTGPLLLAVAADLVERGAELVALVEQAPRAAVTSLGPRVLAHASKRGQAVELARRLLGVERMFSSWPVAAGPGWVRVSRPARLGRRVEVELDCELLACGFGLVPETRLAALLGVERGAAGAIVVDAEQRAAGPGRPELFAAGECCGVAGVEAALLEGELAGQAAAGQAGRAELQAARDRERRFAARVAELFALRPELRALSAPETIVCRCEGVSHAALAAHASARLAKLHTRMAMGPCQGRVCGPAAEFLFGWGPDRPRPPLSPVPLCQLSIPRSRP